MSRPTYRSWILRYGLPILLHAVFTSFFLRGFFVMKRDIPLTNAPYAWAPLTPLPRHPSEEVSSHNASLSTLRTWMDSAPTWTQKCASHLIEGPNRESPTSLGHQLGRRLLGFMDCRMGEIMESKQQPSSHRDGRRRALDPWNILKSHGPTQLDALRATWGSPSPPYERIVAMVVDALRFDFVIPPTTPQNNNNSAIAPSYHHGNMEVIERLLKRTGQSHLYQFVADAPTATTQRLKGLTTGILIQKGPPHPAHMIRVDSNVS